MGALAQLNNLEDYQSSESKSSKKPKFEESPRKILILDNEKGSQKSLSSALHKTIPYMKIVCCESRGEAWDELQSDGYDLIIVDWYFQNASSLTFLNRLRLDSYYRHIPVLITSDLLSENEHNFLAEFSYTDHLAKPIRAVPLIKKVNDLFTEAKWFLNQQELIIGTLEKLSQGPADLTDAKIAQFLKSCPRPIPTLLLSSRMFRENDLLEKALNIALQAEAMEPENMAIESELGKIYLKLGDLRRARFYLEKSYHKSPANLGRLCDLGRIHLEEIDTESARTYFKSALKIDKNCQVAQEGIDLSLRIDDFYQNNSPLSVPTSFASLLNAIGVGLVRDGDLKGGIEHYQTALSFIQDAQKKAYVCFNLGLGFLKNSQFQEAHDWLNRSLSFKPDYQKSEVYLGKAKQALELNQLLEEGECHDDLEILSSKDFRGR